ncbi:MAG: ribonucleoside-diphosphate reductase, adenosylcobalamin-dependent [Candidatus Buchananbacteria bacterium RIFCSPHIGHO2_01_FULL_39_8]|uniref:Vitamin B12-dependent ribonucleotide reductase n=1 Tax=Candidatus Buchananbacteria bacterium RIFCSPHIGHO2_01_FULL_39_8 TaxID=1797533 RepID=A0A1G1Y1H6_9BACT|nr:MAG: ribonucleoside-diphosphate reductase, adenosylcobalamin-dependent [Candidatus Buchananbacteria bacterium RIFCSPHIGHO2_01_FULL_39_8]
MIFGVGEPKLKLTKNALKVLESRYLLRDDKGRVVEKPMEMFKRVADFIIKAEDKYKIDPEKRKELEAAFLEIMVNLEFLPNSPTFSGAGTVLGQLSACFVLPVGDSMEEIFEAIKNTALIHKSGGGTGFSFSRLRPSKDPVKSTSGLASGPVSFMTVFDAATETIKQGGTRRGANMGILRVDHPDILSFITCKENSNKLNNFNISVAVTDKFMRALENDEEYDIINPRDGKGVSKLKAKEVWDKIVDHAWLNGDPGVVFIDTINKFNPTPHIGQIESTNPCGEQPLLPYESCNLGSINLSKFIEEGNINWERLGEVVKVAIQFLDDVIDMNQYPIKEIHDMTHGNRKVGLGVMGWADLLIQLGIPYNSQEALDLAEKVMKFIKNKADSASVALSKAKGVFPNFEDSIYDTADSPGIRNATRTTIAPTGTLSIIAASSSGIEPLYAIAYVRKSHIGRKGDDWIELIEVNPYFEKIAKEKGFYSKEMMEKVAKESSIQHIDGIPESVKRVFVTAHDVSPEWHVRMQAAFQRYVDNAVSKTINFPNSATRENVAKAYLLAYETGCKGITIYRDGSRDVQVLTTGKSTKEKVEPAKPLYKRERPTMMRGTTYKVKTSYGDLYVTINDDEEGNPFEVFANIGKAGGFFAAKSEAICRLISLALRSGIPAEEVIKQIKGIRGPMPSWSDGGMILSLPDAISQIMERHISREQPKLGLEYHAPTKVSKESLSKPVAAANPGNPGNLGNHNGNGLNLNRSIADYGTAPECPECGNVLEISEGCLKCQACGYSKCE